MPAGQGLTPHDIPVPDADETLPAPLPRLVTLDLIRGVAVLGILTINIAGFAGPTIASTTPNLPHAVGPLDEAAFAFNFLFFEGKMRALFSLLFGAGLVLFWERTEAAGGDGDILQLRRLGWLLLLGMLHYLLLWWGDILFVYAACGIAALLLRPLRNGTLLALALLLYYGWHVWGMLDSAAAITAESALRTHSASAAQLSLLAERLDPIQAWAAQELRESRLGWLELLRIKLVERPFWQIQMVSGVFSETLPLMLIGMVMYRRGFFDGGMPRRQLAEVSIVCTLAGLALTAMFLDWAWPRHFPPVAMNAALVWGLAMPHLMGGCGYAGLLVLAAPRLARTRIGRRLVSAGRMAFTNYVLTSLMMTFAFYGWGLGLYAKVGPLAQWLFVVGGWALMLIWSPLWLRRFRRGPLEWLWRSLVEHRALPNRL
ncbi:MULTISPECIES: DUF418 domain-containing protein [unclassified Novosphingobium]|uniref:DUF418 domain-containing protein n=1 Tax=unclassified Novosphingobium TaxID=2644732 RepID=UPI0013568C87|nr:MULTISPECIES: DUF418 domain-containing protein [unclassified Novosphingobium]